MILAIDPGPQVSAWVLFDERVRRVRGKATEDNLGVLRLIILRRDMVRPCSACIIEKVESFGMAVGADVFETVFWGGRFAQAWGDDNTLYRIGRKEVKLALCGSARAKDRNIRQALIDRFGGKEAAIGKKAAPGPLYAVKGHEWSALALAIVWGGMD